jgi:hypothetical protein
MLEENKNGLLGEYVYSWYRVELQHRGALHIHMLLWLNIKNTSNELILATMHDNPDVKAKVKKYQIHTCQTPRCFKSGKKLYTKCKYGFPFELCELDYLDEEVNLYKYKRISNEDVNIVPYNPYLLLLWDGQTNIQYVTKKGIEQYLVKYIFPKLKNRNL